MEHKVDPCSMHIHVPRHCSRNMELIMWQHVIAITRYFVVTELDVEYDVFHMEHMAHSLKPNVLRQLSRATATIGPALHVHIADAQPIQK